MIPVQIIWSCIHCKAKIIQALPNQAPIKCYACGSSANLVDEANILAKAAESQIEDD